MEIINIVKTETAKVASRIWGLLRQETVLYFNVFNALSYVHVLF